VPTHSQTRSESGIPSPAPRHHPESKASLVEPCSTKRSIAGWTFRWGRLLLLASVFAPGYAAAAQSAEQVPQDLPAPAANAAVACGAYAAQDASLQLISKLCTFALTYRHQLPDFIVQQSTASAGPGATAVMSAQVTYRAGVEKYSQVVINGKPLQPEDRVDAGLHVFTTGEFGPLLVNLFEFPGAVEFKFRKTETLNGNPAAVYEFRLPRNKNTFWVLRGFRGQELKPEFHGRLWLEPGTGYPLREEVLPTNLEPAVRISSAAFVVDYAMTLVKDAGKFVLPVKAVSTLCMGYNGTRGTCTTNTVTFHDYQKFVTSARILPDRAQP